MVPVGDALILRQKLSTYGIYHRRETLCNSRKGMIMFLMCPPKPGSRPRGRPIG